jgi:hypothetical protein
VIRHLLADPGRFAAVLAAILSMLGFLRWAFVPRRHVPWFRVATLRARLRLRLHPGRGFASLPELWAAWGRFASFRESRRCQNDRPGRQPGGALGVHRPGPVPPRPARPDSGELDDRRPVTLGQVGMAGQGDHLVPRGRGERDYQDGPVHADQRAAGAVRAAGVRVQPAAARRRPGSVDGAVRPGAGLPGRRGSLYLIADQRNDVSPVAPLFACLVSEIHWVASQLGSGMRGGRLDPPLLLQLDEVARICPIPAPALLADSGGRGITMIIACQGLAQIEERWGKAAARSVLDTSNQLYVSGIQDPDTLDMASKLCGEATYRERGTEGKTAQYPVATPAMIRRLPPKRALVLRGSAAPVITHLPMAWNDWRYRLAKLRGHEVARLRPAFSQLGTDEARPLVLAPFTPRDTEAADSDLTASSPAPGRGRKGHANGGNGNGGRGVPPASYPWDAR